MTSPIELIDAEMDITHVCPGGIAYVVMLAERSAHVCCPKLQSNVSKQLSAEEINQKLQAAEQRRRLVEQSRAGVVYNKLNIAAQKRKQKAAQFKNRIERNIQNKMEQSAERRYFNMQAVKQKVRLETQKMQRAIYKNQEASLKKRAAYEERIRKIQLIREKMLLRNQHINIDAGDCAGMQANDPLHVELMSNNNLPDLQQSIGSAQETKCAACDDEYIYEEIAQLPFNSDYAPANSDDTDDSDGCEYVDSDIEDFYYDDDAEYNSG